MKHFIIKAECRTTSGHAETVDENTMFMCLGCCQFTLALRDDRHHHGHKSRVCSGESGFGKCRDINREGFNIHDRLSPMQG